MGQTDILERSIRLGNGNTSLVGALERLVGEGVPLTYRNDQIPSIQVSLPGRRHTVRQWLALLLKPTELTYEVTANNQRVILFPDPEITDNVYTLFGKVVDRLSGERLIDANIYVVNRQQGVAANEYGLYALRTEGGSLKIRVSYVGYQEQELAVVLRSDTVVNIGLRPQLSLAPIIVTAISDSIAGLSPEDTRITIGLPEVEQLRGPGGEADPMRVAMLLPGITTGADGLGGINIRGSDAGQNLILLDGVPVYNLNHAGGLFSIFNSQAIKRVDLYKSGIPTRFGGRLAGVVDVHTRDGNLYQNETRLSTTLLSSRITTEGPLVAGESSFLVSGRYFWSGAFLPAVSRNYKASLGRAGEANYQLYDLNVKLNHQISENDRLYFSFYKGLDDLGNYSARRDTVTVLSDAGNVFRYAISQDDDLNISWGNTVGALRWNRVFGDNLFGNFSLTYSDLDLRADFSRRDSLKEIFFGQVNQSTYAGGIFRSDIRQVGFLFDGEWHPQVGRKVRFGLHSNIHEFRPQILASQNTILDPTEVNPAAAETLRPREFSAYTEYLVGRQNVKFQLGARAHWWQTGTGKSYFNVLPRLMISSRLHEKLQWQLTFDATVQPIHLLGSATIGLPTDIWVPSTAEVPPSKAYQLSTGLQYFFGKGWEFEVNAYAKRMDDLVLYQGGSNLSGDWQRRISQGTGESAGLEFALNRRRGKIRGWLAYTLARTDRQFDQFINQGRTFPYRYDRRHSISTLLVWQVGDHSTLNLSWRFGSGAAYSFSLESYQLPDEASEIPDDPNLRIDLVSERNGFRLPPNHRLDLSYRFTLGKSPLRTASHTFDVGVYNAYDRRNPIYYELRTAYDGSQGELTASRSFVQVFLAPLLPIFSYELHLRGKRQLLPDL